MVGSSDGRNRMKGRIPPPPPPVASNTFPHRNRRSTSVSFGPGAFSASAGFYPGYHHFSHHQSEQPFFQRSHSVYTLKASDQTPHEPAPHVPPRKAVSYETTAQEEDPATLRELLISLQKQVCLMSTSLNAKLDQLQTQSNFSTPRHLASSSASSHKGVGRGGGERSREAASERTPALIEIRCQLDHLTSSMEHCQHDVEEVKHDIAVMKHEVDNVQRIRVEIEELREYVDRLEEQKHKRKLRLMQQMYFQGLTIFLSYSILASMLGMFQFGYNTGVINAPISNIQNFMKQVHKARYGFEVSDSVLYTLYSCVVSVFAIGGMLGGVCGGCIANYFGRKGGLLLNCFVGLAGGVLLYLTKYMQSYEILIVGRLVIGINCGLNTSLVPMYISEIAPINLRGGLGVVNQLAVTLGLLLSEVLGIKPLLGTDEGWPILLGVAIIPPILQLFLLPFCPESPRYLLLNKKWEEEARKALRKLRGTSLVEEDIEEMRAEENAENEEVTMSIMELLGSPTLRYPLMIGVVMQLSQQFSGINAVFYYSTQLFIKAGLLEDIAKFMTIGIGTIMVAMTIITVPLMDRMGRRTLHLYGLAGMFIFSVFITISFLIREMIDWMSYLSVISVLGFVVFFAVGPGSIPWMITAELFSQGPRPAAMSIAVLVNWFANFLVGLGFPTIDTALGNYTFLPFAALSAIFWIFTYQKVPETKNKTFEEISAIFRNHEGREMLYRRDSGLYGSITDCDSNIWIPQEPSTEQASLVITEEMQIPDSQCIDEYNEVAKRNRSNRGPPPPPPKRTTSHL